MVLRGGYARLDRRALITIAAWQYAYERSAEHYQDGCSYLPVRVSTVRLFLFKESGQLFPERLADNANYGYQERRVQLLGNS